MEKIFSVGAGDEWSGPYESVKKLEADIGINIDDVYEATESLLTTKNRKRWFFHTRNKAGPGTEEIYRLDPEEARQWLEDRKIDWEIERCFGGE